MDEMIATLGSEPQVVTATLSLLARQGVHVRKLRIVHTAAGQPALISARETLQTVYSSGQSAAKLEVSYHPVESDDGRMLADIDTPEAVRGIFKLLYRLVRAAKQNGSVVHLAISGGRKTMALFGMVTAQVLFDENDRLWYLVSGGDFLTSKRLHPQPGDDVHLVPVPVILWSQASPVFTELRHIDDPFEAIERVRALKLSEKVADGRTFVLGSLSAAERRVVEVLVLEGASDQMIAERLTLSPRTVEQHLRSAYTKACDHWELEDVTRAQLIALLQLFYSTKLRENPHDNRGGD